MVEFLAQDELLVGCERAAVLVAGSRCAEPGIWWASVFPAGWQHALT